MEEENPLFKMMQRVLRGTQDADASNWIQIGKLKPEDVLKRKNLDAEFDAANRQCNLLMQKMNAIRAKANVKEAQWWEHLHKKYGLPGKRNYHLMNDGRIMAEPK